MTLPARGRYAPSPTGRLHLGNARTALLAWLWTRSRQGTFVLRVEDLDPARSRATHEARQLADLRWLGLDWDEGPDIGGPHGPYRQSERGDGYQRALARLETFACTCTRRELREATLAPHGVEAVYPGVCRREAPREGRPRALRWKVPQGEVAVPDEVAGPLRQNVAAAVGDFVLRRADGAFAYQLAVVVDDAAMGVDLVVRGMDLAASAPRQVWLQQALGLPTPAYAHVPLLVGEDGRKLSKRDGAPDLSDLREAGVDPKRVVAWLATSCGIVDPRVREISPGALVGTFDPSRVRADPTSLASLPPLLG